MKRGLILLVIFTTVLFSPRVSSQDTNWVKENTWYFNNFVKDILSWEVFRETYIGVAPAPSGDFDQIFYNALFKDQLAAKGHCYGMDVMAMLMKKNGGHLGYCHPPYVYSGDFNDPAVDTTGPDDMNLKTALQMTHGIQINHQFLMFLLDIIAIGKNRDGRYTLQQVNYYLAKNDPPVISVTKGISPADGGHVIIPYFTANLGATSRIYVYDPNRSFYKAGPDGVDYYKSRVNYIEINNTTGAWKFTMIGSLGVWNGDPGSGGNCIAIPLSTAGKKDRLPQSLLADGSYALNTIFIYGNVKVQQVSDLTGKKHLYNDAGTDYEPCAENRLTTVMPYIPMDYQPESSGDKKDNQMFNFRGTDPVKINFKAWGDYKVGMIFHGHYYEVSGKGNGELLNFQPLAENMKK